MAMESACNLTIGRDHYAGKVRMEADYIDFSGPTKFRFRLSELTQPRRDDELIHFNFHGHPVSLGLGSLRAAENWIDYINQPRTLADKLGIKDGQAVRILNLDDTELVSSLQIKNTKMVTNPSSRCDLVMLGVERPSELRQIEDLCENLRPNGAIWVVLPKSTRTVTKANVVAAVREAGLHHVEVVDYSETQHAHKITKPAPPRKRAAASTNGGTRAVTS